MILSFRFILLILVIFLLIYQELRKKKWSRMARLKAECLRDITLIHRMIMQNRLQLLIHHLGKSNLNESINVYQQNKKLSSEIINIIHTRRIM